MTVSWVATDGDSQRTPSGVVSAVLRRLAGHTSWGFAAETGTHALRLIDSALLDGFRGLHMIIGHLGEMLPFAAYRIDRYYGLGGGGAPIRARNRRHAHRPSR